MPIIPIDSAHDPRIGPYVDLRDKRSKLRKGRFIAEGELVVRRLLASGYRVESVLVAAEQLRRLTVPEHVDVYCVPKQLMEAIAGFAFHRGWLACGLRPEPRDLAELVPTPSAAATAVICAAIHDPMNLGGVLRNCAAFGVDLVVTSRQCADPFARRVLRVSMATVLKLKVHQSTRLEDDLQRLRDEFGFHVAATVLDPHALALHAAPRPRRLALLFGNEMHGLDRELLAHSQSRWTIPMRLQTDSLNVAVASGIFLYHAQYSADGSGRA